MKDSVVRAAWWRGVVPCMAVAVLAYLWGRWVLGPGPLDPSNTRWIWGDLAQVYVAWGVYLTDPAAGWLQTTRMSHPLPISISLFDPMPIFLAIAKWAGTGWSGQQYLGAYFLACLVLQGVFGALAVRAALKLAGMQDMRAHHVIWTMAGLMFALLPFTFWRFQGHTALSSQWVIVLGMWASLGLWHARPWWWTLANASVLFLAAGINPYLALMTGMSACAMALSRWRLAGTAWSLAAIAVFAVAAYSGLRLFGFMAASDAVTQGYGVYSMNLLGPIDSNGTALVLRRDIADATGGQTFEGFVYPGFGVLLLAIAIPFLLPATRRRLEGFPWATVVLLCMAAFVLALSSTLTVGAHIHEIVLPDTVLSLLGRFRASGRFFWLCGFWIIVLGTTLIVARMPRRLAAIVLCGLVFLQFIDVAPIGSAVSANMAAGRHQEMPAFSRGTYAGVVAYPPFQCSPHGTPLGVRNYEAIGFRMLRDGLYTNSFYAARNTPEQLARHCSGKTVTPSPNEVVLMADDVYRSNAGSMKDFDCRPTGADDKSWMCLPR